MREGKTGKKLRSQDNCKAINNPCRDFVNSALIDANVSRFLAANSQLHCEKINSQSFRKPKAGP